MININRDFIENRTTQNFSEPFFSCVVPIYFLYFPSSLNEKLDLFWFSISNYGKENSFCEEILQLNQQQRSSGLMRKMIKAILEMCSCVFQVFEVTGSVSGHSVCSPVHQNGWWAYYEYNLSLLSAHVASTYTPFPAKHFQVGWQSIGCVRRSSSDSKFKIRTKMNSHVSSLLPLCIPFGLADSKPRSSLSMKNIEWMESGVETLWETWKMGLYDACPCFPH